MEAPIIELFSSFQGEGLLLGRRQVFVRFAGCNLDCFYCDTPDSKEIKFINLTSTKELNQDIQELITPDLHSISFTGGEPLLQADFISEFLEEKNKFKLNQEDEFIKYPIMIETNGTLPNQIKRLVKKIDYVSLDIKLSDHFFDDDGLSSNYNENILNKELKSLNILIKNKIKVYCKIAVLPTTNLDTIENICLDITEEIPDEYKLPLIIQPVSPIELWDDNKSKLFKFSEIAGKYLDVYTIPQVHKYLDVI